MPPLPDQDQPLTPSVPFAHGRNGHPSPLVDGLRLEVMSDREIGYWGHRFGIDTPYFYTFTGWGEIIPLIGGVDWP